MRNRIFNSNSHKKKIQAVLISDYSKLAVDISDGLNEIGLNCRLLTATGSSTVQSNNKLSKLHPKIAWLKSAIRSWIYRNCLLWTKSKYCFYKDIDENSNYYSINDIKNTIAKPDIIFILFDYRIITTRTIKDICQWSGAKVFWLLADMSPMTGGCSYSLECNGYKSECRDCPAIGNPIFKNFAEKTLKKKKINLKDLDIEIITFSSLQYQQAKSSFLFGDKQVHQTFFPIDASLFKFVPKNNAKKCLLLPDAKFVVFFGAASIREERKGFSCLLDALNILKQKHNRSEVLLLIAGGHSNFLNVAQLPFDFINFGFIDFSKLALLFQAADVFLCPSLADSGPTMVNQSIMCGTPVVAFEVGVSADLVINGSTGYIANIGSAEDLCNGLEGVLDQSKAQRAIMIKNCLNMARVIHENNFFTDAAKYINESTQIYSSASE